MIENVADLKKLIQDLDDDTIIEVDDGGAFYGISDAELYHHQETISYHVLFLRVNKIFNEKEKVDDYYIKGEQVLSPLGKGDWDANIIHNDG